jgi:undecaprenyl diphosphate synthase
VGLYETYLATRIRLSGADLPQTVALVVTETDLLQEGGYETLEAAFGWAFQYGAERVLVYVSVLDEAAVPTLKADLESVDAPREMAVRSQAADEPADAPIQVSIGLGGKAEFAGAVRSIAEAVEAGDLDPDDVTESAIEERLVFPTDPDLLVKTGAERLSDFMIWQSVYSELYFTDVNWQNVRLRDYLRALRDYQDRQRRFGR